MIVEKEDLKWLILIAVLTFVVYANALGGDFVYDDHRQILLNPLIQDPSLYGKALTSDVWAFKGDGTVAASNYYRPTFVALAIGNYSIFGANPFGWHLLSLLLHIGVCCLAYVLLRRVGLGSIVSFAATAVFAVHPVHVESVSWIAGSADILFSLFLLASLLTVINYRSGKPRYSYAIAVILYALALGSKEVAMLCFPLYFMALSFPDKSGKCLSVRNALFKSLPFAVAAVLFFIVRLKVLGSISLPVPDAPTLWQALVSTPTVFVFYCRQVAFPYFLAENYPLRPLQSIDASFFLSLLSCLILLAITALASWRSPVRRFGLALFLLPLLPALFIRSFPSEQIVHDRYLYLPLLGVLIIIASLVSELMQRSELPTRKAIAICAAALTLLLGLKTVSYNRVWSNDLALWSYNADADPYSSITFANLGAELSRYGRNVEAVKAFDKSLENKPSAVALMSRARVEIALKRYDNAISDLNQVIGLSDDEVNAYTLFQSYEAQAIAFTETNDLNAAEHSIRDAVKRLPTFRAALTDKLAIILYNSGRKEQAYTELKAAREAADQELLPASKAIFFRLGMIETELGDQSAARADLQHFLSVTSSFSNPETDLQRRQAIADLSKLK